MQVKSTTTVAELMSRFPNGYSVGPGTPEKPGELSQIIYATSHFRGIASNYSVLKGMQGYIVADMDE